MTKLNLLILGGGNGPHCYSALASSLTDVDVRVLALYQDEAARWNRTMNENPFEIAFTNFEPRVNKDHVFKDKPRIVTNEPSEVVPDSHLIVFMVPAFAHSLYFQAIKPYLRPGMIICGLPGGAGFIFQALDALGLDSIDDNHYCLLSFSTLPWACRLTEFGRSGTILAVKDAMSGGGMGTMALTVLGKTPVETIEYTLLGRTKCELKGHLLGDTISYVNSYIHPCIEYGKWSGWDGRPVRERPDFYHGANQLAADLVAATSLEGLKLRDEIQRLRPELRLDQVVHVYDWYCQTYADKVICDKTSLYGIFRTHKGYAGIKHSMVRSTEDGDDNNNKYLPDFEYRHFSEDVPCGQVVLKGIAEILGVETPNLDRVITWAQGVMGKEYLIDGKLVGKDLGETRSPQRFGITTLEGLLGETRH